MPQGERDNTVRYPMEWDAQRWPNFSIGELECSHTSECNMDPDMLDRLQRLRDDVGPLNVTSGYRSPLHPIEASKGIPGTHARGQAVDIAVKDGSHAFSIVGRALYHGFTGIGLSLKGSSRFIHLDTATTYHVPRPAMWTY